MASLLQTSYGYQAAPVRTPYVAPPSTGAVYMKGPAQGSPTDPLGTMAIPGTGYTPDDYARMALDDPIYRSFVSGRDQEIGSAGTSRKAALQALALNYGGLPPGQTDPYGDLSPDILSQAANNPQSTLAQLQRSYGQQNVAMQNQLGARGALHSGDLVAGQDALNAQLATDQSNAAQGFGSQILGAVTDYTTRESAANAGAPGALQASIQDLEGQNLVSPNQKSANLVPNWQSQYGRPMYAGPDGALYAIDEGTGGLVLYATPSTSDPTGWTYTGA
jgi:hypothetical protein